MQCLCLLTSPIVGELNKQRKHRQKSGASSTVGPAKKPGFGNGIGVVVQPLICNGTLRNRVKTFSLEFLYWG